MQLSACMQLWEMNDRWVPKPVLLKNAEPELHLLNVLFLDSAPQMSVQQPLCAIAVLCGAQRSVDQEH